MERTYDDTGGGNENDVERGYGQVPREEIHTKEQLEMIQAAMMEELGIGRKDALRKLSPCF
jgi:hypothetical protein